jgi:hypothetical protein
VWRGAIPAIAAESIAGLLLQIFGLSSMFYILAIIYILMKTTARAIFCKVARISVESHRCKLSNVLATSTL